MPGGSLCCCGRWTICRHLPMTPVDWYWSSSTHQNQNQIIRVIHSNTEDIPTSKLKSSFAKPKAQKTICSVRSLTKVEFTTMSEGPFMHSSFDVRCQPVFETVRTACLTTAWIHATQIPFDLYPSSLSQDAKERVVGNIVSSQFVFKTCSATRVGASSCIFSRIPR